MKRKYKRKAALKDRKTAPVRKGQRGQGFLSSFFLKKAENLLLRQIGKTALKKL